MAVEYVLPSGAKLSVSPAPFADANALMKAVLKSLQGMKLGKDVDIDPAHPGSILKDPSVFMAVIDKMLSVATSEEVEATLFKCCERANYEGVRVTRSLFDDPKMADTAREDYFTLCAKVIEVNCKPFFKQTFSGLKGFAAALPVNPKS